HELKDRGIKKLKVLYSDEVPCVKQTPPGSISFVPSVAGLMIAGEVIRDLLSS
ncbi:MAG: tRNA threonylcarbamoyladenosine dehydratase, partial [Eubacterium sp.]